MLLAFIAVLLVLLLLITLFNFFRVKILPAPGKADKEKEDEFAKIEEKFKPKGKSEEMARCSECGKIIPMSSKRCTGCGLRFED